MRAGREVGGVQEEFLRGCLYKNYTLSFAPKVILPETLATERRNHFLVA